MRGGYWIQIFHGTPGSKGVDMPGKIHYDALM